MRNRLYAFALALAALVAIEPGHARAQTRIGQAATVKPDAHADARLLSSGADIHANETVRTGSSGVADLRFQDNTKLAVGPSSTVKLNKFVYDPNKGTGSIAIEASRGAFRFVTGSGGGTMKTPYGTLGVRG